MKKILTIICLIAFGGLVAGCSETIYGIPKSEWYSLTPREKQQLAATNELGQGSKPSILKIFEKPKVPPEQAAKDALATGNNAEETAGSGSHS